MRDLQTLTPNQILRNSSPELLFSKSESAAKAEYRELAKMWHPDQKATTEAAKVFAHINQLYEETKEKITNDGWLEPSEKLEKLMRGLINFTLHDGTIKTCKFHEFTSFELGYTYVCDNSVAFEVAPQFTKLFDNGRKRINSLPFADDEMMQEMTKYLPQIKQNYQTKSSRILVVRKTPDQLRLSDVLEHLDDDFATSTWVRHSGWILNGLLNIACYLEWAGISHNAILLNTVYISPLRHSVMLLGGWWYATKFGDEPTVLPSASVANISMEARASGHAIPAINVELIKALGRQILGYQQTYLDRPTQVPLPLHEWLTEPVESSAFENYKTFKHMVLPESFGPPKFIKLELTAGQIYNKEK